MVIEELEGNTESKDESCIPEPNQRFSSMDHQGKKHNGHLKKEKIQELDDADPQDLERRLK